MLARKIAWTLAFAVGYSGGIVAILNITNSPWIIVLVVIAFGGAALTVWAETPRMAVPPGLKLPVGIGLACAVMVALGTMAINGAASPGLWYLLIAAFALPWGVYPVLAMRERHKRNREVPS